MQTPISRSPFDADCYSMRGLEFNVVKQTLSRDYEREYIKEAEKIRRSTKLARSHSPADNGLVNNQSFMKIDTETKHKHVYLADFVERCYLLKHNARRFHRGRITSLKPLGNNVFRCVKIIARRGRRTAISGAVGASVAKHRIRGWL